MEYRRLGRTGVELSVLGFGAATLGNEFGTVEEASGTRAVQLAIDRGINYFDTSPYYGRTLSETRLGSALAGRRDQVVVGTKCGRYGMNDFDFSAKRVTASIDESLARLRTGYVDLLTAHDIEFGDREQIIEETIPAMRRIQESGKARYVGISGLPVELLADVAKRGQVDYMLSYCHYNLMVRDLDWTLRPFAEETGIGLINASPLAMGLLTPGGPPAWHPAPDDIRETAKRVVELCQTRGVDATAMALRFCLDYPHVASTLSGMSSVLEVERNLGAFGFEADEGLRAEIERMLAPVRDKTWASGRR